MLEDSIESLAPPDVLTRAGKIKVFLMDVDGALTMFDDSRRTQSGVLVRVYS